MKPEHRPKLHDYLDYRLFLKDHLSSLSRDDRKYSLRWLAKRAGFPSPSHLSMVLSGQRSLTKEKLHNICTALHLNNDDEAYLGILVELSECNDLENAERIQRKIQLEFREGLFKATTEEEAELFSHWTLPALMQAVALKDFKADPFWLANRIGISPKDAQEGFEKLIRIGLIKKENGKYTRTSPSIKGDKFQKIRIADYYMQSALLAIQAITLPKEQRFFDGLTIALSRESYNQVKKILERTIREIDMLGEADPNKEDLIQINIQSFIYGLKPFREQKDEEKEHNNEQAS
jgi:uncharacterized protein (TIGR02147 family)